MTMKQLMLIVAIFVFIVAQTAITHAQTPNLSVLSTHVELVADYAADARAARTPARVNAYPVDHTETEAALERMGDIADKRAGNKYRLSIVVRNDGAKAIRSVIFEYPLGYSRARKPPVRITFKAQREINPTEPFTLSHNFITVQHVVLRSGEQATIKRIDYADGSVWRR
jgi:hypothetical protein